MNFKIIRVLDKFNDFFGCFYGLGENEIYFGLLATLNFRNQLDVCKRINIITCKRAKVKLN